MLSSVGGAAGGRAAARRARTLRRVARVAPVRDDDHEEGGSGFEVQPCAH
jgi:hypothetical protein